MTSMREIREHLDGARTLTVPATIDTSEYRSDTGALTMRGVAAVFNSDSEPIFGMFIERIKRGAFRKVLAENPDIRLLVNHDGLPMARTTNGTLRLTETTRGLEFEAELADTTHAKDVHTLVERGDLDQMSFAFTVAEDEWSYAKTDTEYDRREIKSFNEVTEISVVTFPAYRATSAEVSREAEPESQEHREGSEQQLDGSGDSPDSSTQHSASDSNTHAHRARELELLATGAIHYESRTQGGARSAPQ